MGLTVAGLGMRYFSAGSERSSRLGFVSQLDWGGPEESKVVEFLRVAPPAVPVLIQLSLPLLLDLVLLRMGVDSVLFVSCGGVASDIPGRNMASNAGREGWTGALFRDGEGLERAGDAGVE